MNHASAAVARLSQVVAVFALAAPISKVKLETKPVMGILPHPADVPVAVQSVAKLLATGLMFVPVTDKLLEPTVG